MSQSSSFIYESRRKSPDVTRVFTFGGSDYSDHVMKWPKFARRWDEIKPKTLQMTLANGDNEMGFLQDDKTLMQNECLVKIGFAGTGGELMELFAGTVRTVTFRDEKCVLNIVDKFQQLSDRKVGTNDAPVAFTGSNYLPSDLAWFSITSHGGYSAIESTSNPDIDFDSFQTWAAVFSGDTVTMKANFTGQKVTEILRKLAHQTHSGIYIEDNKIAFKRFGLADVNVTSLGEDVLSDVTLKFDTTDIINRQHVSGNLTVGSTHQFTVTEVKSSSVNSFGVKDNLIEDNNIWYVDSASAINLAQRKILVESEPDDYLTGETGLAGIIGTVGQTVYIKDDFHGISENYRVLEQHIDIDAGKVRLGADRTTIFNVFILDTSTLGNTVDVLT